MCVQGIVDGPQGSIRRRVGLGVGIMTTPARVCARDCGCASREYQKARGFVRGHPNDANTSGARGCGPQGSIRGHCRSAGECGHHGRRRSVVVHGQSECVQCNETHVFAPGAWRCSRQGLRVKGRVNMKAQVNRRAVLRSLRFWVEGLRFRIEGVQGLRLGLTPLSRPLLLRACVAAASRFFSIRSTSSSSPAHQCKGRYTGMR